MASPPRRSASRWASPPPPQRAACWRSLVYGVSATAPTVYLGSALALLAVAALACLVPALRASRIEPMEALRYE